MFSRKMGIPTADISILPTPPMFHWMHMWWLEQQLLPWGKSRENAMTPHLTSMSYGPLPLPPTYELFTAGKQTLIFLSNCLLCFLLTCGPLHSKLPLKQYLLYGAEGGRGGGRSSSSLLQEVFVVGNAHHCTPTSLARVIGSSNVNSSLSPRFF